MLLRQRASGGCAGRRRGFLQLQSSGSARVQGRHNHGGGRDPFHWGADRRNVCRLAVKENGKGNDGSPAESSQAQQQQQQQQKEEKKKTETATVGADAYLELEEEVQGMEHLVRQSLRSQLTGGVQATTATLDLPEPQVAVRNLVEYAKHAHMSTVMSKAQHRRAGYPFGSIVEFAVDAEGAPVFAMSSLAIHTRNVLANPRCAIQIHAPGWTGLNNSRVTLFGDVYPVSPESASDANELFASKRRKLTPRGASGGASSQSDSTRIPLANTRYFVMDKIVDVLFVGGYGTVTWINPKDYKGAEPDFILEDMSHVIKTCNETFAHSIKKVVNADDVVFISVDKKGVELRVREGMEDTVRRLVFKKHCYTVDDIIKELRDIIKV